jgi:Kef-type K+ transport system membrane component KefB
MNDIVARILHEFHLPLINPVLVFSIVLLIILISPILLRRINIPGIVVLIAFGVILGPHGLNFLERNSAVDLFSTIGLLYIMFIAGLELEIGEFKKHRSRSYVFAGFTFSIPLILGFPVCYYLLEYDVAASLLTAGMFATHTLVTYPIVSRFGIAKDQAVAITVGGTILTDTAVLLLLAVIISSGEGGLDASILINLLLSILAFAAFMFVVIPRFTRWFFIRLEGEKYSHYVFVLFIVFLSAFLAEIAGVEPIIGAFAAGLALNRYIPHSSVLMNRVEFIGNSLFVPFFLISVGMLVDLSVIMSGPRALIVAGVLTIVALVGKWAAAQLTRFSFHYSKDRGNLIFGLSSAHAAATLAVILVGFEAGVLDENILNGTVILILVTCIVASLVTDKAARAITLSIENGDRSMESTDSDVNEHIMLSIANWVNMERMLEFALLLRESTSVNPVSIISVVANDDEVETNVAKARRELTSKLEFARALETKVNIVSAVEQNAASGIIRTSKEIVATIVLLGWPRHSGMMERIVGGTTDTIINNIEKSVFVCGINRPSATHERVVLLCPPLIEREQRVNVVLSKILRLAAEFSSSLVVRCNTATRTYITRFVESRPSGIALIFQISDESSEYYEQLKIETGENDLIAILASRRGSVSYRHSMDGIVARSQREFSNHSRVVIYP